MIQQWQFGTRSDGQAITAYQLTSNSGFRAVILDQGATLQSLYLPNGRNITLGFDVWEPYERDDSYIGRIIGPNANRIRHAQFQIDGEVFLVPSNDGPNNLHSGPNGFDGQRWYAEKTNHGLNLYLHAPNGENGFPGAVEATLEITLKENKLRLEFLVTCERPTPINLTWHPYWNLNSDGKIDGHNLQIKSQRYTKIGVPSPDLVNNTDLDFRAFRQIGGIQLDSNYQDVQSASLTCGDTTLTVTSSLPDMQIYTGDALLKARTGLAIEPQYRPNDINLDQASLLRPGETYNHWIEYCFDIT